MMVRLIMHGIPEDWVNSATAEGLQALWEIVKQDSKEIADVNSAAFLGDEDS